MQSERCWENTPNQSSGFLESHTESDFTPLPGRRFDPKGKLDLAVLPKDPLWKTRSESASATSPKSLCRQVIQAIGQKGGE